LRLLRQISAETVAIEFIMLPFRFSEIEQHVPYQQCGVYEIRTITGIPLKVGISDNLRRRLLQHRASRQSALTLKPGGTWENPQDVRSKQSILAHHLYYDAQIAPGFDLCCELGRCRFLEDRCVIVVELTDSIAAAKAIEKQREQIGGFRYVGRVLRR
jgi:hypothetical protein